MFLIWVAGGAVSFVAIFFYGYEKVKYISNDGDSESSTSACQIRMPATESMSNQTRPAAYEGVFSCEFYDGMVPFSPVFSILATLVILFFSCNSCVLGQKISLVANRRKGAGRKMDYNDDNNNNNIQGYNFNNTDYVLHNGIDERDDESGNL
jgi:hypothetical protein